MLILLKSITYEFGTLKDMTPGLTGPLDWLWKLLIPIILTFVFAFFVGLERQNMGKAAGISAHILVALASVGLSIMQRLMYENQFAAGIGDPEGQRVIAQIIAGVGFIGAGVIMKDKFTVKGLTTAATIWTTAVLGIILGSGYLVVGTGLGIIVVGFIVFRDLRRGINPLKTYKVPHQQVKKYRFVKKDDLENVIEEDFHIDDSDITDPHL